MSRILQQTEVSPGFSWELCHRPFLGEELSLDFEYLLRGRNGEELFWYDEQDVREIPLPLSGKIVPLSMEGMDLERLVPWNALQKFNVMREHSDGPWVKNDKTDLWKLAEVPGEVILSYRVQITLFDHNPWWGDQ